MDDPQVTEQTPQPAPAPAPAPQLDPTVVAKMQLHRTITSGAHWFYWIAALSLINSIIAFANGGTHFVIGLGVTQIIDTFPKELGGGTPGKIIALLCSLLVLCIYVLLGFFAVKRQRWAFISGIILYTLDSLIFLAGPDFLSIGFHAFALYGIVGALRAHNALSAMEVPPPVVRPVSSVIPPPVTSSYAVPPPYQPPVAAPAPPAEPPVVPKPEIVE